MPSDTSASGKTSSRSRSPTASVAAEVQHEDAQRQRAMRVDVRIRRQAMQVVLPANRQIGPWQARAAHLLALAEKVRGGDRDASELAREAAQLLQAVEEQQQELGAKKRELPSDVAASSRLEDTGRALASVERVLRRTLALLAGEADDPPSPEPTQAGSSAPWPDREARPVPPPH